MSQIMASLTYVSFIHFEPRIKYGFVANERRIDIIKQTVLGCLNCCYALSEHPCQVLCKPLSRNLFYFKIILQSPKEVYS